MTPALRAPPRTLSRPAAGLVNKVLMSKLHFGWALGPLLVVCAGSACSASGAATSPADGGGGVSGTSTAGTAGAPAGGGGKAAGGAGSGGSSSGTGGTGGEATAGAAGNEGEAGSGGAPDGPLPRPNILILLMDDMGYSDLGAYGGEIRTPNIDGLAQTGTRFRNFYVTPRCSPTRISLLTGLYTQQGAKEPGASLPPLRTDNNVTLPEMLGTAGYRTYMAGKWHIGTDVKERPNARGFEHVFGFGDYGAGAEADKWDKTKYGFISKNSAIPKRTYGDNPGDFYQSNALADYALDYLDYHYAQGDDAPFFMYMASNAPHFPVQAPRALIENPPVGEGQSYMDMYAQGWGMTRNDRYQRMLDQGVIDATFALAPKEPFMTPTQEIPAWTSLTAAQKADLTRKMALYAGSIESMDDNLGRVVARLKELGQFDNTLIFVLSDNGGNYEGGPVGTTFGKTDALTGSELENMGQPGQDDHMHVGGGWAHVETTPFRFFKHYTHGGGVRSPLVVSWPANTATPGGWTDQVAHVIDLTPTILAAAQIEHPKTFDGHGVLPMEGTPLVDTIADGAAPVDRQIGFEHETNRAWIDGKYKMVARHENDDVVELYDLEADPTELDDLAAAQPARVKTMVQAWNAWATRVGVPAERKLTVP